MPAASPQNSRLRSVTRSSTYFFGTTSQRFGELLVRSLLKVVRRSKPFPSGCKPTAPGETSRAGKQGKGKSPSVAAQAGLGKDPAAARGGDGCEKRGYKRPLLPNEGYLCGIYLHLLGPCRL